MILPQARIARISRAMLAAVLAAIVAGLCICAPKIVWGASPELAAAGSFFLPGLGQAANSDYGKAGLHFGSALVLASQYSIQVEKEDYILPADRVDNKNKEIDINRTSYEADLWGSALFNLSLYSSFAAYRDGRQALSNQGYETPAPGESLADLASAPFQWDLLIRPTTFVPLLIPLYFALTPPADEQFLFNPDDSITREEMAVGFAVRHNMVAVGEEAFFRGLLNNGFSSSFGDTYGLLTSSVIFGLAHQGNAGQATAAGAGLFGLYIGYLQQINGYRIDQGVAVHFWWNFLVSVGMLAQRKTDRELRLLTFYTEF